MKVWVVHGYDFDWKDCFVEGVYSSQEEAIKAFDRIRTSEKYWIPYITPAEVWE